MNLSVSPQVLAIQQDDRAGYVGRIPVRNIWLLVLYASELYRELDHSRVSVEDNPDEIPDLVAEILTRAVERRLRRNLSYGYVGEEAVLTRVRGSVDMLRTERHRLLEKGRVACKFENLTANTVRNRFVRAALAAVSGLVKRSELARRCRMLSTTMYRTGVVGERPSRTAISLDRFGRHDKDDRLLVAAAKLAFDLALPTESSGGRYLVTPIRDVGWMRRLYEKAVAGFYDVTLSPLGWRVKWGTPIGWQIETETAGIGAILPSMRTDIVLENPERDIRLVIDTKFNSILTKGWYREESLRSGYVYQIYAYLRSQERSDDPLSMNASGFLLHPSVGKAVDESVVIQGHRIRFATVDLGGAAIAIRQALLQLATDWYGRFGDV